MTNSNFGGFALVYSEELDQLCTTKHKSKSMQCDVVEVCLKNY